MHSVTANSESIARNKMEIFLLRKQSDYKTGVKICALRSVVDLNVAIFRNIAPCSPYVNRLFGANISSTRFGGTYLLLPTRFLARSFTSPWRWTWCVPPNHWSLHQPRGVTSPKTAFFIVTAVTISNLTGNWWLWIWFHDKLVCIKPACAL
jgi:hypothetical protein